MAAACWFLWSSERCRNKRKTARAGKKNLPGPSCFLSSTILLLFTLTGCLFTSILGPVCNDFPWPDMGGVGANGVRPPSGGDANDGANSTKGRMPCAPTKSYFAIEAAAQAVLDARAKFQKPTPLDPPLSGGKPEAPSLISPPLSRGGREGLGAGGEGGATLADLYDPLTMPPELVKAHQALDRAVDSAYGRTSFKSEAERVAFLFERYQ